MMVGVHVGMSRRRTASGPPVAPGSPLFAAFAYPDYTRYGATFATSVPCIDGVDIRWWYDTVSAAWYEQATSGARLILRANGAGKWYAEGGTGRFHVFGAWAGTGVSPFTAAGLRSQTATWSNFSSPLGPFGITNGSRQLIYDSGSTNLHLNPPPTTGLRNNTSVSTPLNMSPINEWFRLSGTGPSNSGIATGASYAINILDGSLGLTAEVNYTACLGYASDPGSTVRGQIDTLLAGLS